MTTAYHPQANCPVERFHRQLKSSLRACLWWVEWIESPTNLGCWWASRRFLKTAICLPEMVYRSLQTLWAGFWRPLSLPARSSSTNCSGSVWRTGFPLTPLARRILCLWFLRVSCRPPMSMSGGTDTRLYWLSYMRVLTQSYSRVTRLSICRWATRRWWFPQIIWSLIWVWPASRQWALPFTVNLRQRNHPRNHQCRGHISLLTPSLLG